MEIYFLNKPANYRTLTTYLLTLAMPASPITSNYPLNEQWAPLAVYG